MNPDPIPTPGGTASAAAQAGAGVWNQSSQLAQLANSSTGLAPSMSFLVGVLLFLLAVAVGWLAIAQSFSAGKGNTQKTRQQGVVMASAIGWGTVSAIGFVVFLVGAAGWFLRAAFSG